jgi:hypothetical protein
MLTTVPLLAVEIGDTYEKVVDESGMPTSKIEIGRTLTLNYPESTIKLLDGKVASIKMADVQTDDTYKMVVEKKGVPASKIEAGVTSILRYMDVTIKLRDDKVVSIKLTGPGAGNPVPPKTIRK